MREALEEFRAPAAASARHAHRGQRGTVVTGGLGSRRARGVLGDGRHGEPGGAPCRAAPEAGEVLVGPSTRRLTSPAFDFGTLPPMTIKGKAEPVPSPAWKTRATPPTRAASPAWCRRSSDATRRSSRSRRRSRAWRPARGVVAVTGDPGLGKSRLVAEVRSGPRPPPLDRGQRPVLQRDSMSYAAGARPPLGFIGLGPDAAPEDLEAGLARRARVGASRTTAAAPTCTRISRGSATVALDAGRRRPLVGRLAPEALRSGCGAPSLTS